jgi:hypothetical protein
MTASLSEWLVAASILIAFASIWAGESPEPLAAARVLRCPARGHRRLRLSGRSWFFGLPGLCALFALLAIVLGTIGCRKRAPSPGSVLTGVAARDIDGELRIAPASIGVGEAS